MLETAFYPQFPLFLEILLNTAHISIVYISYLSKHSYATKASTFLPRAVDVVQSVSLFFTGAFWLIFSLSLSFLIGFLMLESRSILSALLLIDT